YLFYQLEENEGKDKFYALRFDLNRAIWEDEPLEFQVALDDLKISKYSVAAAYSDFKPEHFSPEIQAIVIRKKNHQGSVGIAISLSKISGVAQDDYTFYWFLHNNGRELKSRWMNDGWRLCISGETLLRGRVQAYQALELGHPND